MKAPIIASISLVLLASLSYKEPTITNPNFTESNNFVEEFKFRESNNFKEI